MKNAISTFIVAIACLTASLARLSAQENKEVAEKVAPIAQQLADLHDILSARKSLSLTASASGHVEPGFGHDDSPDFTGTFKLFYKGDRFLYNVEFIGPRGPTHSQIESFDGERYKLLNRIGGILSISSERFVYDVVMSQWHVLFMPFTFLQSAFSTEAFPQLSYNQLITKDDWQDALASLKATSGAEEVSLDNQQYRKLTKIGKNVDPVSDQACVFDVYFAKNFNWYPMKWERRQPAGNIVTTYSVEELGFIKVQNSKDIPYPKISVLKHYRDNKLRDTARLEVKEISFDSVTDNDLWIDPASANIIRDLDKNVR